MSTKPFLITVILIGAVCSARAQTIEVTPYLGYTTSGTLEQTAPEIDELRVTGGFTWGAQFDYFLSSNLGLEASWIQQETALQVSTARGRARLFDIDAGPLHGGLVYHFGNEGATLRPFVLGSAGATFFRASNVPSETKFSWAVGGGVKAYFGERFGVRVQARFSPTRLNASSDEFCGPFGFCADNLNQAEIGAGFVCRF